MSFDFRTELGKMTPKIAQGAKVYVWGCGKHWEFICKRFKYLVDINIDDCIDGFIDGDVNKQGKPFHNKIVKKFDEIDIDNSVILTSIASGKDTLEIGDVLAKKGLIQGHSFILFDWHGYLLFRYEYERLLQFKDCHKGKRCFIIGNGPSLLASDLDKLKNEFTFASNRIYLMFDKTVWRPSYYVIGDPDVLRRSYREINVKIECPVFYADGLIYELENFNMKNGYFYSKDHRIVYFPSQFIKPTFSEEPFILSYGATVTYECLQLAAYMGFSEIYLLGVDHNYRVMVDKNGELITDKVEDYFTAKYISAMVFPLTRDLVNGAYTVAREYAETHGIKIRNATRGGKLEIFERVDFDGLF
ncbi:MAG: DUF115 domain-containing protein [Fibromonadaceae bacterium]|jgi:hypothetical protein|nr:DUF115 domain-containing protein [Fibromonadaceae bacterium]